MQIDAYLERIGLTHLPPVTSAGLQTLQDAHMCHVPFENLNVILRRPLNLGVGALFDKIVTRRRGGYCFELNTLYAELLRHVGFDPVPMMARVWLREPQETPPRTHLVHRVEIEGEDWLTDVGFGGRASRVPLRMRSSQSLDDGDGLISIKPDDVFGYRVTREQDGDMSDQFTVEAAAAHRFDILCGNHWTENHPDSHFRQGLGVGLFTAEGRTSFYNGVLTHRGAETTSRPVASFDEVIAILQTEFGISTSLTKVEAERLKAAL